MVAALGNDLSPEVDDQSCRAGSSISDLPQHALSAADIPSEQRWRELLGATKPKALTGMLLDAALAYETQCNAHGGLTLQKQRELSTIAQLSANERRASSDGGVSAKRSTGPIRSSNPLPFAVGTEFHREWQGRLHVVMMTADGLLWSGETFGSLSAVARAITGTRWNGYRFFGVRRGPKGVMS